MATPHLAGSAAIVRQQHPTWSAAQVRSAIVNTSARGVLRNYLTGTPEAVVNIEGTGRENLQSAVNAQIALDPVSVSFGAVPNTAGQIKSATVTLTNLSGAPATLSLGVSGSAASLYSLDRSSVTLAGGASGTVTVTLNAPQGIPVGGRQAWLDVGTGGNTAHAAIYTYFK
jgi:subtilisin family serine protease